MSSFYKNTLRDWATLKSYEIRSSLPDAIPSWSTLRTLGSSKIVGATMFVPFLGTLILFNQYILDAVRVSEDLLNAWGMHLTISAKDVSLLRLKITYFGLCLVGIASFIFTLTCPEVVKRYASSAEYVRGDEPLFTGPQIEEATGVIISNFMHKPRETEFGRESTFACPQALVRQTYIFLGELGAIMLKEQEEAERSEVENQPPVEAEPDIPVDETDEERMERWEQEDRYFL